MSICHIVYANMNLSFTQSAPCAGNPFVSVLLVHQRPSDWSWRWRSHLAWTTRGSVGVARSGRCADCQGPSCGRHISHISSSGTKPSTHATLISNVGE